MNRTIWITIVIILAILVTGTYLLISLYSIQLGGFPTAGAAPFISIALFYVAVLLLLIVCISKIHAVKQSRNSLDKFLMKQMQQDLANDLRMFSNSDTQKSREAA